MAAQKCAAESVARERKRPQWSAARRGVPIARDASLRKEARLTCSAKRRSTPSAVALRAMADESAEAHWREGGPLDLSRERE